MAAIAQTIAIVDRSGKVVSTSKQLKNVFSEAKLAYQERKAEIKAERKKKEDRELQKAIKAMSVADDEERSEISRSRTRRHHDGRKQRDHSDEYTRHGEYRERHDSTSSSRNGHRSGSHSPRSPNQPMNLAQFNQDLYGSQSRSMPVSPIDEPTSNQLLRRSQTEGALAFQQRPQQTRSYSAADIDMDLAYGEFHAGDLTPVPAAAPEKEISGLIMKCQGLLDEANCATYSVKKIIVHLQENPDAMAAVALTLAEISNVASKMAPGALKAFSASAPAVMALLAAPEFLIAVGVGVGITVVMFGGYKIIKKIKGKSLGEGADGLLAGTKGTNGADGVDEMIDIKELDHIERWRRGIVETQIEGSDAQSVVSGYSNTSVEGEFITPFAQRSMGHLPLPAKTRSSKDKDKDKERSSSKKERKRRSSKTPRDDESVATSESASSRSGSPKDSSNKQLIKVKKPSPLRRMFTVSGSTRS